MSNIENALTLPGRNGLTQGMSSGSATGNSLAKGLDQILNFILICVRKK